MPSLKYFSALSLGVALSGLILGVSCTSLFTGVTSPSHCGKQIVIDETHKTRLSEVHKPVVRKTGGDTEPGIKLASNRAADSFLVKPDNIGAAIPESPTGVEKLLVDGSKSVTMVPARPMVGLPEPPIKELIASVPMPIVSQTGVPSTPKAIPPVKEVVNSASPVGDMAKKPEKMPSANAQDRSEAPKPVVSPKIATAESPRKEPVTISENNVVRIVESAGNDVIVTSFDAVVIIKGRCGKLTVAGGKNRIQCDIVREIEVIGNGNTMNLTNVEKGTVVGNSNEISWKELINGKEPKLISTGVDNKLLRTP